MSAHQVQDHQAAQRAAREAADTLRQDHAFQQSEQIRHWAEKLDRIHDQKAQLEALLSEGGKRESLLNSQLAEIQHTLTWRMRTYIYQLRSQVQSAGSSDGKPRSFWTQTRFLLSARTWRRGRQVMANVLRQLYLWAEPHRVRIAEIKRPDPTDSSEYMCWEQAHRPDAGQKADIQRDLLKWEDPPLISILMPVYNSPPEFLRAAIDSLRGQLYPHWELCLVDDASTRADTRGVLKEAEWSDSRIRVAFRPDNGHICRCSNDALKMAQGDFCALMDHDDVLPEEALYEVAREWKAHPELDLVYTDEDKIDGTGLHFDPHFKPDWCPENLLTRNYLGHLTVIRTSVLREVGGFREGFEGSQDYDLILRITERTDRIAHIPKVLYHWRVSDQSVAGNSEAKPYAYAAAQAALSDALGRRGETGRVEMISLAFYDIRRTIRSPARVSLILPTGMHAGALDQCLLGIFRRTAYRDFEVIAVDSSGGDSRIRDCLSDWSALKGSQVSAIPAEEGRSLAHGINRGATHARGDILVLFQPHLSVLHTDWMSRLLEEAQRSPVGVVGCHLIDSDNRFRHCGMILGAGADGVDYLWRGESSACPGHLNMLTVVSMFSVVSMDCCMLRKSVFQEALGFDEALPDDLCGPDFCLRTGTQGYRHLCHPRVRVLEHPTPASRRDSRESSPNSCRISAGRDLFRRRHALPRRDPCVSAYLIHPGSPGYLR
jgi:glycosyltransferase involved in cell wall biosynthesis